jgi:hypothetical protein
MKVRYAAPRRGFASAIAGAARAVTTAGMVAIAAVAASAPAAAANEASATQGARLACGGSAIADFTAVTGLPGATAARDRAARRTLWLRGAAFNRALGAWRRTVAKGAPAPQSCTITVLPAGEQPGARYDLLDAFPSQIANSAQTGAGGRPLVDVQLTYRDIKAVADGGTVRRPR